MLHKKKFEKERNETKGALSWKQIENIDHTQI